MAHRAEGEKVLGSTPPMVLLCDPAYVHLNLCRIPKCVAEFLFSYSQHIVHVELVYISAKRMHLQDKI